MKYSIIENSSIEFRGRKLYQIRAEENRGEIKEGSIGGYIESTDNLDMNSDAWIGECCYIGGDVRISNDTILCGTVNIFDSKDIITVKTDDDIITVFKDYVSGGYKVVLAKDRVARMYDFFISRFPENERMERLISIASKLYEILLEREVKKNG